MKCANCGKQVKQTRDWQRYCSKQCRWKKWDKDNPRVRKNKKGAKP